MRKEKHYEGNASDFNNVIYHRISNTTTDEAAITDDRLVIIYHGSISVSMSESAQVVLERAVTNTLVRKQKKNIHTRRMLV